MKKVRKLKSSKVQSFLISCILLLLTAMFGGCSSKSKSADEKKIVVWHWMSDRQAAFDELAKRYEQATGIGVAFELYAPSDAYAQKVRAAAQSNTLPEIYGILAEARDFASFIKSGYVENLTPAMEQNQGEWKKSFYPKALATNTFTENNSYGVQPGIYGVPIDMMSIQMLYNKNLFKKAGLDPDVPPKTWDEFVQAARKLKQAEIPVFVSGWGELWLIDCLSSVYAIHWMGEQKFFDTLKGKVAYTDADWIKVLKLFDQMREEKMLFEGAVTMINKTAEQTFANERAAFALNGSWCVNVYGGMNPDLQYGAMLPPKIVSKNPIQVWGGAGSSFVVSAQSAKKEQAAAFLKWLTEKEQQAYLSDKTNNLPANASAAGNISPLLASFGNALNDLTHPSQWPVHEKPVVSEAWLKGIQSILIGEKTPQEVAKEVQKLKEREMSGQ